VSLAPIPTPLASHSTLKRRSKLGRAKIGVKHNLSLILSNLCPLNIALLCALDQGSYNGAKIFDEPMVEGGQPLKATNLHDSS